MDDIIKAIKTGAVIALSGVAVGFVVCYQSMRGFNLPSHDNAEVPDAEEIEQRVRANIEAQYQAYMQSQQGGQPDPTPPREDMDTDGTIPASDPTEPFYMPSTNGAPTRMGFEDFQEDMLTPKDIAAIRTRDEAIKMIQFQTETGNISDWENDDGGMTVVPYESPH